MALTVLAPCGVSQVHPHTFSRRSDCWQDTWSALPAGFTPHAPQTTELHSILQRLTVSAAALPSDNFFKSPATVEVGL